MKRAAFFRVAVLAASLLAPHAAWAWNLHGYIYCDATRLPLSGVQMNVSSTDGAGFAGSATSDAGGYYQVSLPDVPGCYQASPTLGAGESIVSPASPAQFCTTNTILEIAQDWVISSPSCSAERCWLTGGGAKYDQTLNMLVAQAGRQRNFGGNVNPGCNTDAGQGGQWNHVSDNLKLHFQGTAIQVIRCGNVDGIPPGSTSPATPFNFIEFKGTGRLKGIKGNKVDMPLVYFFGRSEDRNEPGSKGQNDGAGKDRYFLNVYSDPLNAAGSTLLLIDNDGDPTTVDPVTITDGNLQIHVSSCDAPPVLAATTAGTSAAPVMEAQAGSGSQLPSEPELALASANPATSAATLRFAVPRDANVSLAVFDVTGRQVGRVLDGRVAAGTHSAIWNLQDASGARVARGVYFVRLTVDGSVLSRAVTLR